jgi:hypothetical protein
MNHNRLVTKLDSAIRRSHLLLEEEHTKAEAGAYHPLPQSHVRVINREKSFKEAEDMLTHIREALLSHREGGGGEDTEDLIFLARHHITKVVYPWIKRKDMNESMYEKVYQDIDFEPYTKDLPKKRDEVLSSSIALLGLTHDLEEELRTEISKKYPHEDGLPYEVSIQDVLNHKDDLSFLFKDGWTHKAHLIFFRLYEYGCIEKEEILR